MSPPASNNEEIKQSLQKMEESFYNALNDGPEALNKFLDKWSSLERELATAQTLSILDAETRTLAYAVATYIATMGRSFLDADALASSLHPGDIWRSVVDTHSKEPLVHMSLAITNSPSSSSHCLPNHTLSSRHPTSIRIPSGLPSAHHSRTPSTATSAIEPIHSEPNPLPHYIEHAYKFFLANIFNPYPTRAQKEAIVAQTNDERVTLTSVSNWFTNARRRSGWSKILKERCGGNREQLIAAATRVFINPDPKYPIDPVISKELMEMKEAVETMYGRKGRTSAWVEELESLIQRPSVASPQKPGGDHLKEQEANERDLAETVRVTKVMVRDQAPRRKNSAAAVANSLARQSDEDEELVELMSPAGVKRKFLADGDSFYRYPMSVRSSSSISDVPSESRVPSLSWSDSGDEQPNKGNGSSTTTPSSTPYSDSPSILPELDGPTIVDSSFTLDSSNGSLLDNPALCKLVDLTISPCESVVEQRKKRVHDDVDHSDFLPPTKRRRNSQPVIASVGPDLATMAPSSTHLLIPIPSTPLFTPRSSFDATSMQAPRRASLDISQPPPVQLEAPDPALPLDIDIFDWSSSIFGDLNGNLNLDCSELLQPAASDSLQTSTNLDFDYMTSPPCEQSQSTESFAVSHDLSVFLEFMSNEALQDMRMAVPEPQPTPLDSQGSSTVPPVVATAGKTQTRALDRERKRKMLEEKRAELEALERELNETADC